MELGLLSNSSLNPRVYWTTLLPPLFSGLAEQPGVRTISPPPLAWARREDWREVRSEVKGCDTLFRIQLGSRPPGAIHAASYLNSRARRSNFILDAWRHSLTKIGIVATIERLNPCFVAYREAKDELERRFPLAKFVWLPFGADTDIFYPRKEEKSVFAFWMGRRHEPLHQALLAYCEARGLRYVYSNDGRFTTEELGRLTSTAEYFVATPPDLDNPERTGGFSPLVMRYFEGTPRAGTRLPRPLARSGEYEAICPPTRCVRCRRTDWTWLNASTRIETTRAISALWRPRGPSCANIIPGDGAASKFSIISPLARQLIFARSRMRASSVALSPALPCRES